MPALSVSLLLRMDEMGSECFVAVKALSLGTPMVRTRCFLLPDAQV